MPDEISSLKVVCSGGLNSNENSLDLSENKPGTATRLVNYEPSLYGGYRRIEGYDFLDTAYPVINPTTGEGPVLGIAIFKPPSGSVQIIGARKVAGQAVYKFYRYVFGTGWNEINTGLTHNSTLSGRTVRRVRHKTFNFGDGNKIIFVDGVNPAVLYDGTSWVQIKSTNTGEDAAHAGGNQAIDAPAVVEEFYDHIFLAGDPSFGPVVAHSAPRAAHDFTVANGAGQIPAGTDVVQIKPFRESLFVFGENEIKKIVVPNTDFVLNSVTTNIGCIARDSVMEIGGDLLFLAPDGLRPVAGTSRIGDVEIETISKAIQQKLSSLPLRYDMDSVVGVVLRKKSQIRLFFGGSEIDRSASPGILGGLTLAKDSIEWEFGDLLGIRANCATSGYVNGVEYVLHGDYDGSVYRQEQGKSFAGNDILGIYSTPYLDGGDPGIRKTFRELHTYIRAEGPVSFNIGLQYDWGDSDSAKPRSFPEEILGALSVYNQDGVRYNDAIAKYSDEKRPVINTNIEGSGFSVRVTYATYGISDPHTIQGFVFDITARGRK